jgi:hypothetical protein
VATEATGVWRWRDTGDDRRNDDPKAVHDSPRFSGLLAVFGVGVLLLVESVSREDTETIPDQRPATSVTSGFPFSTM